MTALGTSSVCYHKEETHCQTLSKSTPSLDPGEMVLGSGYFVQFGERVLDLEIRRDVASASINASISFEIEVGPIPMTETIFLSSHPWASMFAIDFVALEGGNVIARDTPSISC